MSQSSPLAAYAADAITRWHTPGFALAVVHGDTVVLLRGFGQRRAGDTARVNADTRFAIGSAGKSFTAAAAARLVEQGRLRWDDPVVQYLPEFRLADAALTRAITVRDLLSHRSGLPRGDDLWYDSGGTRQDVLRRVRRLRPEAPLRARFGYQSIMYLAAGEVIGRAAHSTWDEVVSHELIQPLGMTRTTTRLTDVLADSNSATPHRVHGSRVQAISYRDLDNIAPAGGVYSTARDLARWLSFQLGDTPPSAPVVLTPGSLRELHRPEVRLDRQAAADYLLAPGAARPSYGMGWFIEEFEGTQLLEHSGMIDGMTAHLALLPERHLGVAVVSNLEHSELPAYVVTYVLARWLHSGHIE